jgi:hypothetical protein
MGRHGFFEFGMVEKNYRPSLAIFSKLFFLCCIRHPDEAPAVIGLCIGFSVFFAWLLSPERDFYEFPG